MLAYKIRIHGDYHLGQVLFTGKDFYIIDFEGEPARPTSERRLKYSALRDVAGMVRSFHYAVFNVYFQHASVRPEDREYLEKWLDPYYYITSGVFLRGYKDRVQQARFVPDDEEEFQLLLEIFLLDKAIYELGYELNNRPTWVLIPIEGIKKIMGEELK